jgi:hypothetical protein
MLRNVVGLMVGCAVLSWAGLAIPASSACSKAQTELAAARVVLSQSLRNADQAAAAYLMCTESKKSCAAEKRALDGAMRAKRSATDGYAYAAARAVQVCQ